MHRSQSRYGSHPRITWFGIGGTVAYVDYVSATRSYFIGSDSRGGFQVIPPSTNGRPVPENQIKTGFATIDEGIAYALGAAG